MGRPKKTEQQIYNEKLTKMAYDDSASESLFTRFKVYVMDNMSQEQVEIAKGCVLNQNCISIYVNDTLTQVNYPSLDMFMMDMRANGYVVTFLDKSIKY